MLTVEGRSPPNGEWVAKTMASQYISHVLTDALRGRSGLGGSAGGSQRPPLFLVMAERYGHRHTL